MKACDGKTNALGIFDFSACDSCPLLNNNCPYNVTKAEFKLEGTYKRTYER